MKGRGDLDECVEPHIMPHNGWTPLTGRWLYWAVVGALALFGVIHLIFGKWPPYGVQVYIALWVVWLFLPRPNR